MALKSTCKTWPRIAEDEPVFCLRAQDQFAPATVRHWADMIAAAGAPVEKIREAELCARAMEDWQRKNGCKVPD